MTVLSRAGWLLAMVLVAYLGLAVELMLPARTVLPLATGLCLAWCVWGMSPACAVLCGAMLGFAGDAAGEGAMGPGVVSATLMTLAASGVRVRQRLESPAALAGLATLLTAGLLLGRAFGQAWLEGRAFDAPLETLVAGARGIATGIGAALPLLAAAIARRVLRLASLA
ncbi:MAG: hypothetical protein KF774_08540 [Planctomyces sp.]|nr:hypothetical protein [Planctomyces sp.]